MTEKAPELSADDKHRMNFMGLVLLLRQMATQLLEENQTAEARGLVDSIETLQAKTKGNVGEEEARLLEGVLFELRMAVVKGPPSPGRETGASEPAASPASGGPEVPRGD